MSLQDRMRVTKEKIFAAAMELFNKKGFEATQVSEIAEKAGIGKGTFFNYFPTKQSVFGFIGRMNADALSATMEQGTAEQWPVDKILLHQARTIGAWAESNRAVLRQAVSAGYFQFTGPGGDSESRGALRAILAGMIERGQEGGEFRKDVPAGIAALAVEGMYFSLLADWARSKDEASLSTRLEQGLDLLLTGLRL